MTLATGSSVSTAVAWVVDERRLELAAGAEGYVLTSSFRVDDNAYLLMVNAGAAPAGQNSV